MSLSRNPFRKSSFRLSLRTIVPYLLLFALPLLLHYDLLSGSAAPVGDLLLQDYPYQVYSGRRILQGDFPLWAPEINLGHPFLGEIHTGSLYLPNLILSLFIHPAGPALTLYDILLHRILGGFLFFLFLQSRGRSRAASLFGSLALVLGGAFVEHAGHGAYTRSLSWTGLILLGAHRFFHRKERKGGLMILAGLALSFLAGSPPVTYMQLLLLFLYALFSVKALRRKERLPAPSPPESSPSPSPAKEKKVSAYIAFSFAFVTGLLLVVALIQLLATLPLVESSARSRWPEAMYLGFRSDFFSYLHLIYGRWFSYHPRPGFWEFRAYAGAVTLFLAIRGIGGKGAIREALLPLFLVGTGLLLAQGDNPVHSAAREWIPGFASFRVPGRYLLLTATGLSMLAARGLDRWLTAPKSSRKRWILPLLLLSFILLAIPFYKNGARLPPDGASLRFVLPDLLSVIGAQWLVLFFSPFDLRLPERLRPAVPLLLLFVSAFLFNRKTAPLRMDVLESDSLSAPTCCLRPLPGSLKESLSHNHALLNKEWSAAGYLTLETSRAYRFKEALFRHPSQKPSPGLLGAGSFLSYPGPAFFTSRSERREGADGILRALETSDNPCALFLETGKEDSGKSFAKNRKDLHKRDSYKGGRVLCTPATSLSFRDDTFRIIFDGVEEDGYVYLSQSWNRGWRAYVDGKRAPVLRANFNFMAVPVRRGSKRVEIRFGFLPSLYQL